MFTESFTWKSATEPPDCAGSPQGFSIECLGVIVTPDGRFRDLVAYWPEDDIWTVSGMDDGEPADFIVDVSHWSELPELPREDA